MKGGLYAAMTLFLLALGGTVYTVQLRLDMQRGEGAAVEELTYLPRAEYLKVAALGYDNLLADLIWLKAVQHIGERKISGKGYDWIYAALDTVTTLDPKFVPPYEVGGLTLTILADKADLSNKLLEKGVNNNPEVWQFPFYLGFNYFFYMKDFKEAARYMEAASRVPGSPPYLPLLASRLYVSAGDPAYSLQLLVRMYENTKDENMRARLAERIGMLQAVVTASGLQKVVDAYKARSGRTPSSLEQLVREGVINSVPEEPNGGRYYIDQEGKVKSSKVRERLGIYSKQGAK